MACQKQRLAGLHWSKAAGQAVVHTCGWA
jgi:hypothetical protein